MLIGCFPTHLSSSLNGGMCQIVPLHLSSPSQSLVRFLSKSAAAPALPPPPLSNCLQMGCLQTFSVACRERPRHAKVTPEFLSLLFINNHRRAGDNWCASSIISSSTTPCFELLGVAGGGRATRMHIHNGYFESWRRGGRRSKHSQT